MSIRGVSRLLIGQIPLITAFSLADMTLGTYLNIFVPFDWLGGISLLLRLVEDELFLP